MSFDMHILEVEYKHPEKEKWSTVVYGPFKNHYSAMVFYDLVLKPKAEHGTNVTTRRLETPGSVFSMNAQEWIKQFT